MLHRTCEKLHGSVRLGGLSMPNVMCMPFYFKPRVLIRTLSHLWCKLNLPIVLFSMGLLTLIYIDSLIVLAMPWSFLPIIWKLSWVVVWPVLLLRLCIEKGSFRCFFESFSKGPRGLSYVFFITCKVPTLEPVDGLTFVFHRVLVFGGNKEVFNGVIPFGVGGCVCHTYYKSFWCFHISGGLGACSTQVVSPITNLTGGLGKPSLHPAWGLFGALTVNECFPEILHFFLEKFRLIANCFALWVSVLITLCLADRWWWLSHCTHWSMWVGFLYTVRDSLPSASGLEMVSKKGMAPSCFCLPL